MRLKLEIDRDGNLYSLLLVLLNAYNRRTDVLARPTEAEERLKQFTARVKTATAKLAIAIKSQLGE